MKDILQGLNYVDRRVLLATILLLAAAGVLFFVVLGSVKGEQSSVAADFDARQAAVVALEQRVDSIRQGGAGDIQKLIDRVGAIERVTPMKPDLLTTTALIANMSAATGTVLSRFMPLTDSANGTAVSAEALNQGMLTASPYVFDVSGTSEGVASFLDGVLSSDKWVATVESLSFVPKSAAAAPAAGAVTSVFGSEVTVSGVVLVWALVDPPIVASGAETAPAPALPVQTAQPVQPAQPVQTAQPSQPVQPAQPVQPVQPAQPSQPVQPVQPSQPAQPTTAAAPAVVG